MGILIPKYIRNAELIYINPEYPSVLSRTMNIPAARDIISGIRQYGGITPVEDNLEAGRNEQKKYSGRDEFLFRALQYYSFALRENPDDQKRIEIFLAIGEAMLNLGYLSGGDYTEEAKNEKWIWINKAKKIDPTNYGVIRASASMYYTDKKYNEALNELYRIKNRTETWQKYNSIIGLEVNILLGRSVDDSYQEVVTYNEIDALLEELILPQGATQEEQLNVYNTKGNIYLKFNTLKAAYFFCLAIYIDQENPWLWHNMSICLLYLKIPGFLEYGLHASNKALSLMLFGAAQGVNEKIRRKISEEQVKGKYQNYNPNGILSEEGLIHLAGELRMFDEEIERRIEAKKTGKSSKTNYGYSSSDEVQPVGEKIMEYGIGLLVFFVIFYFVNLPPWFEWGFMILGTIGAILDILGLSD